VIKTLSCLLFVTSWMWAQSTAQISGSVKDQTGAVVADAQVTATNTDTGLKRTTMTDAAGGYALPNLPVGPYRLEASAAGFRTYLQTGIVLQVADNPVINPTLDLGQVSDQVEVEAAAPQVETRDTGVSQVMDSTRVVELPLNGRQVTDLIVISGAATVSGTTSFVRNYPSVNISVAGGMHNGLTYLLDGASHNDPINGLNLPLPFPDALQEFKLETSSLTAQYGQHSAGAVNAVTKSGTNGFHGDLFEFFRNGNLNALNFFAKVPDQLKRNQFGGTIGGRIIRDKLFFFGSYQGTRMIGTVAPQFAFLPTQQMLNGDWTAIASAACNGGRPLTLKAPFTNNQISPSAFSPIAVAIMNSGKLPIATDPCGKVQFGIKPVTNEDVTIEKIDYQINERHSLFGRYELAHLIDPSGYVPGNLLTTGSANNGPYTTYPVVNLWQTQSLTLGDTYLIHTNLVSSFRASLLRPTNSRGQPPQEITPQSVGITPYYQPTNNPILGLSVSGGFSIGGQGGNVPGTTNASGLQVSEDLSWVRGAHQFAFGFNNIYSKLSVAGWTSSDGVFAFNSTNTGLGLGDFMLGDVNNFMQQGVQFIGFRSDYIGAYVQDTWKLNPRFTLNAGLRWDPFLPFTWGDGQSFYFEHSAFDQGIHSTVYPNAPAGVLYSGDPSVPANGKTNPNQLWHFSPRLGIAFDPTGKGKMTIRASYGLFRDYPDFYESQQVKISPPYNFTIVNTAPGGGTAAGFANPWINYPGGSPFPVTLTRNVTFPTNGGWVVIPPNLPAVYVNQWNLSVQRQIGANWLVTANYIGSEMTHLLSSVEGDPAIYIPGASCVLNGVTYSPCSSVANTTQRRQLYLQNPSQGKYFGSIVTENATGTMSYNGLFLTAQHNLSDGLVVQANYTWSHCINTGTQQLISIPIIAGISPVPAREGLRGNCSILEPDRRHNFNLSVVYVTPKFGDETARLLASGWQVSGIVRVLSGDYFSAAAGVDQALSGTNDQRPQQVLPNVYAANKSINQWLNPAAFAQPTVGTYGNMGPGTLRGPGFFGIDTSVTRRFVFRERHSVEVRGEAFNVMNHVNPLDPVTTSPAAPSARFSQPAIRASYNSRSSICFSLSTCGQKFPHVFRSTAPSRSRVSNAYLTSRDVRERSSAHDIVRTEDEVNAARSQERRHAVDRGGAARAELMSAPASPGRTWIISGERGLPALAAETRTAILRRSYRVTRISGLAAPDSSAEPQEARCQNGAGSKPIPQLPRSRRLDYPPHPLPVAAGHAATAASGYPRRGCRRMSITVTALMRTGFVCGLLTIAALPSCAQVEKIAMSTTGISCGICAGLSEIYFRRLPGVDQVKISLSSEAIMLTYRPGAKFDPEHLRKMLEPLKVGVVQFQIGARGQVEESGGKRIFTAGRDRFVVLDAIDSPEVPLKTPVRVEGILFDHATPMELKILTVKPAR